MEEADEGRIGGIVEEGGVEEVDEGRVGEGCIRGISI